MKLRAQITIDMEADDFIAAADFQRQVQVLMHEVRAQFQQADLDLRERRGSVASGRRETVTPTARARRTTGALHLYEEPDAARVSGRTGART